MFAVLLVTCLVAFANAQIVVNGPCPDLPVIQNFDVAKYLGKWNEIERFPMIFQKGNCSVANYGPVDEDGNVKVVNTEIVNNEESVIEGIAYLAEPEKDEAKLKVVFYVGLNNETIADYWVLGTDYDNYSLVWTCSNFGANHLEFSWILGRTKPLNEDAAKTVEDLISTSGIDRSKYVKHDQAECEQF